MEGEVIIRWMSYLVSCLNVLFSLRLFLLLFDLLFLYTYGWSDALSRGEVTGRGQLTRPKEVD